jgi:hypothetical protein
MVVGRVIPATSQAAMLADIMRMAPDRTNYVEIPTECWERLVSAGCAMRLAIEVAPDCEYSSIDEWTEALAWCEVELTEKVEE